MRLQCSKCGNWVEGQKIDTIARKTTRKVVGLARKGGMAAVGAAIGSVIPVLISDPIKVIGKCIMTQM